jgi:ADP-dependent NAD(P)H-hydrate dehydratase / NAD(P)H-hydrate epimerase
VIPIVTPAEMGAIDRAAAEPVEELIGRAGGAVARVAIEMLGGTYGRHVVVIAGKGNNGNDGREAARRLSARGVRVSILDATAAPERLPNCDLVIDAAYGTGFRGDYRAPSVVAGTPALAVDIPSGVDGSTGSAGSGVLPAVVTVTFAGLKPGLVLHPGAGLAGDVRVVDIGLDVSSARAAVVEAADVRAWLPRRDPGSHKWRSALWVVAGSPGMEGSAALVAAGAQRAGAGYVRQSTPGGMAGSAAAIPVEVVQTDLPAAGWAPVVIEGLHRFAALVVGNGLGTGATVAGDVAAVVAGSTVTTVVDADGITALGDAAADVTGSHVVLTPHDGEFARLAGHPPGPDRLAATRDLSARLGAVVLLKGGPTIVASPDGFVLVVTTGDERLATAGTGDVLAGIIGAIAAQGVPPFHAAAAGAFLHGAAGALGWRHGLVAGDLPGLLPAVFDRLREPPASDRDAGTTIRRPDVAARDARS